MNTLDKIVESIIEVIQTNPDPYNPFLQEYCFDTEFLSIYEWVQLMIESDERSEIYLKLETQKNGSSAPTSLYDSYKQFCFQQTKPVAGFKKFSRDITKAVYLKHKKTPTKFRDRYGVGYRGIKLQQTKSTSNN